MITRAAWYRTDLSHKKSGGRRSHEDACSTHASATAALGRIMAPAGKLTVDEMDRYLGRKLVESVDTGATEKVLRMTPRFLT